MALSLLTSVTKKKRCCVEGGIRCVKFCLGLFLSVFTLLVFKALMSRTRGQFVLRSWRTDGQIVSAYFVNIYFFVYLYDGVKGQKEVLFQRHVTLRNMFLHPLFMPISNRHSLLSVSIPIVHFS